MLPVDGAGADEAVEEQDDSVTALLFELRQKSWSLACCVSVTSILFSVIQSVEDLKYLISGPTYTLIVLQDELLDLLILDESEQLQLRDIRMIRSY